MSGMTIIDHDDAHAEKVRFECDNLNAHSDGALSEAFSAEVALSLCRRLEIVYPPKHESWLDLAENELSVLTRECVRGIRFELLESLRASLASWSRSRNAKQKGAHWQFATADAHTKHASLYPIA